MHHINRESGIKILNQIPRKVIETKTKENEENNVEKTFFIDADLLYDSKNKGKFRKKIKEFWSKNIPLTILTAFTFNHLILNSTIKVNVEYFNPQETKNKYLDQIPYFAHMKFNDPFAKGDICKIIESNEKFEKKETLWHLLNLQKIETDLLYHVVPMIIKLCQPIFYNHTVLTTAKLKQNKKIKRRNMQMLPNVYKIEKKIYNFISNFFEEVKKFDFDRILNLKKMKRNNGRESAKYLYYAIKDLDRLNFQVNCIDSIHSCLDITQTNSKWRILNAFFHKLYKEIYESKNQTVFNFYSFKQKRNVNKCSILYELRLFVWSYVNRDYNGNTISDDEFIVLNEALQKDFYQNEKISNFYKETKHMIFPQDKNQLKKKRKRNSKEIQLHNVQQKKMKKQHILEWSFISEKTIKEYKTHQIRLKKQFEKTSWDNFEPNHNCKTPEFIECYKKLESSFDLEISEKKLVLQRNVKWKKLKTNMKKVDFPETPTIFKSIPDFKMENFKKIQHTQFRNHIEILKKEISFNIEKKKKNQKWEDFAKSLFLKSSFIANKTEKNQRIFQKIENEMFSQIYKVSSINMQTFESVYYVFKKTGSAVKACTSLDNAIDKAVLINKTNAIAEIESLDEFQIDREQ